MILEVVLVRKFSWTCSPQNEENFRTTTLVGPIVGTFLAGSFCPSLDRSSPGLENSQLGTALMTMR